MMEKEDHHNQQKELQLLPIPQTPPPPPPQPPPLPPPSSTTWLLPPDPSTSHRLHNHPLFKPPQPQSLPLTTLDLQLSISCADSHATRSVTKKVMKKKMNSPQQHDDEADTGAYVQALRWQASQETRLAAMERAYAERVREMTRREMEMAHSEFARARAVWERAKEEVTKAERMKESAIHHVFSRSKVDHQSSSTTSENIYNNSNCIEITCHCCRQRFRP